eukprot:3196354-Rhodomonas_salina.1
MKSIVLCHAVTRESALNQHGNRPKQHSAPSRLSHTSPDRAHQIALTRSIKQSHDSHAEISTRIHQKLDQHSQIALTRSIKPSHDSHAEISTRIHQEVNLHCLIALD